MGVVAAQDNILKSRICIKEMLIRTLLYFFKVAVCSVLVTVDIVFS